MWLFAGLGNPGDDYEKNRHNVGFMVADKVLELYDNFAPFRSKYQGLVTEGKIGREKVLLLKPQTYMNLSGDSVAKAARFYKISPDRIVIFHDELDVRPGEVKIKQGGGNAGHNGLKSIQACIGTPDFWRVRIGIGRPPKGYDVSKYVLNDFAKADQEWLEPLVEDLAKNMALLVRQGPKRYEEKLKNAIKARKQKAAEKAKEETDGKTEKKDTE